MTDIVSTAFLALRERFFDEVGRAVPFHLRDKLNTQDDPFDEFLATNVLANLAGISCAKASGPLITPDMVLYRRESCELAGVDEFAEDFNRIVGIEVKKLNRTKQGGVARASGLDYNTTPPCGRVRIYDAAGRPVDIRSSYLFVCLEADPHRSSQFVCTALALVDGSILNTDFELYLSITGERRKRIGLGTFGNGADRARPMLIFANPLGVTQLDHAATLIHPEGNLAAINPELGLVYEIERTVPVGGPHRFYCYRVSYDVSEFDCVEVLEDPFPTPKRDTRTRPRGRFRLPFQLGG